MRRRNVDSLVDKIVIIAAVSGLAGCVAHCAYQFGSAEMQRQRAPAREQYEQRGPIHSQMYVPVERVQNNQPQDDAPRQLVPY